MKKYILSAALALTLTSYPSVAGNDGEAPLSAAKQDIYREATPQEAQNIEAKIQSGELTTEAGRTQYLSNENGSKQCKAMFLMASIVTGSTVSIALAANGLSQNCHEPANCLKVCEAIQCTGLPSDKEGFSQYYVPVLKQNTNSTYAETFRVKSCKGFLSKCQNERGGRRHSMTRAESAAFARVHDGLPVCEEETEINRIADSFATTSTSEPTSITSDNLPELIAIDSDSHNNNQ
jgi:hypothetical protein